MKKFTRILALTLPLAVAGVGAQAASAQADTLTIGLVAPLSGAGAAWGEAMKGALEFAVEDVNKDGGLTVAGANYELDIAAYDSHYRPNDAVTAMNRLIFEDEVKFVVGPLGSAPLVAVAPMTTENKILNITAAFTPAAASPDYPYVFRAILPTAVYADLQIDWVVKKLGSKRVGGLFPNDESGQSISKDVVSSYEKSGAVFVTPEFFARERVDFIPLLTRVLAQDIDTFELDGNSPQTAGLLVKQLRELGFKGNIIRTGGDATGDILAVAGEGASDDLYVHQEFDQGLVTAQDYEKRYIAAYGGSMNAFSPIFYSSIMMVLDSMKSAKSVEDVEKIAAELGKISNYEGLAGSVNITGEQFWNTHRQLYVPYSIAKITGGVAKTVATCNLESCE